jgi:Mg2+-importing ATPase
MNLFVYCTQHIADVLKELGTSAEKGLSLKTVKNLQRTYGFNEVESHEATWWQIFFRQLKSPFVYLLFLASLIAFLGTGDVIEGALILIIVIANSFLGFYQEYKASQTLRLLKTYIVSHEKILRAGKQALVPTRELVPGDIVFLEPGDSVPADIRVLECQGLFVDESVISGEAIPVAKISDALPELPKQFFQATNFCFAGTTVVGGNAKGVVVATGLKTKLGSISQLIHETERESTFSKNINRLSKFIILMVLITLGLILVVHFFLQSASLLDTKFLVFIIALTVTIIPELLPTVLTFCLSQGAQLLARSKVVVKRLSAIEDLGSIQVLCTDKTGTLTENKLVVTDIYADDKAMTAFFASLLSTDISLKNKKHAGTAFDTALFSYISPEHKSQLAEYEMVAEVPFEPARRRGSMVRKKGDTYFLIVRGAYEELEKTAKNLDQKKKEDIARWVETEGEKGRRVIAISKKEITQDQLSDIKGAEKDLEFLGIIAFEDPIKESSFEAIKEAQLLGVQIKILTGDSPEVAGYVGQQVGITTSMQDVITGDAFEGLSPDRRKVVVLEHHIFARIAPEQKYEIIKLLQEKYEVGYLGDGINDAPALKIANVAIVVEGAADIAQEAADIVLLKKSLFVIVEGIKEGRKIFANTMKYLTVCIATNFGNFYGLSIASMILDYLPMLPLQLLLANILSDLPMLGIATDNVDIDELKEPESYNLKDLALISVVLGSVSALFDLIFFATLYRQNNPQILQTGWFMGGLLTELLFIVSIRSRSVFFKAKRPSFALFIGLLLTTAVTFALPYTYVGEKFFHFIPLSRENIATILAITGSYFVVNELIKILYYKIMTRLKVVKK